MTHTNYANELTALDDLRTPFSSGYQKLYGKQRRMAKDIQLRMDAGMGFGDAFDVAYCNQGRSRAYNQAVLEHSFEGQTVGRKILPKIGSLRAQRETYLTFNGAPTEGDYMKVLTDCKFTQQQAAAILPTMLEVSENLRAKKPEGLRSILVG
jgi:hypothetical protein